MTARLFTADWIHQGGTFRPGLALLIGADGRVVANGPLAEVASLPAAQGAVRHDLRARAIAPGTVSAHSHAFQVFLRGAGDHPLSFADWVGRVLYPVALALDDEALEAASLLCFAQMAQAGITTVGEFHYVHNGPDFAPRGEELARIVIGAARQVGLRIALIDTLYDVTRREGQRRMARSVEDAVASVRRLAAATADDPAVTVLPAPHSLHGATRQAVEAAAALADELDTRWHIHLAEQQGDEAHARQAHGNSPLQVLEDWGVLSERTVLVHGIWLAEAEQELLAERGGALVSNPTTNMALGDGIAPLPALIARGVPVALGTDMNAAPNVFHEIRTAEYLQRVKALEMGCLPRAGRDGPPDPARLFTMGTRWGGEALGLKTGDLEPGWWADFLVLDLSDPSLLPGAALGGDALLNSLSSSMVPQTAIEQAWVGGRSILQDGALTGIEREALAAKVGAAARAAAAARPAGP